MPFVTRYKLSWTSFSAGPKATRSGLPSLGSMVSARRTPSSSPCERGWPSSRCATFWTKSGWWPSYAAQARTFRGSLIHPRRQSRVPPSTVGAGAQPQPTGELWTCPTRWGSTLVIVERSWRVTSAVPAALSAYRSQASTGKKEVEALNVQRQSPMMDFHPGPSSPMPVNRYAMCLGLTCATVTALASSDLDRASTRSCASFQSSQNLNLAACFLVRPPARLYTSSSSSASVLMSWA
jgi:hypothetical protein